MVFALRSFLLRGTLAGAALLLGCGNDGLQSATSLTPPETTGYDPSNGQGEAGGYYGTSDTDGEMATGGPTGCDDESKRCPHEFQLADANYCEVRVMGDFASDCCENGVLMAKDGDVWRASIPVSWSDPTLYNFQIDGNTTWVPDPDNPNQVDDGAGGVNSVLDATMCTDFSCEPNLIGTFDWRDAVIYFVFVDRFLNGDPSNDGGIGVPAPSDWQGGDWAGVTSTIDSGYFEDLGVNVLWISVPMDNTNQIGAGSDGNNYSGYHGYWPSDLSVTEEHFGTLAELQQLVDTAHDHGLKVLFDYAMNHVHDSSPVFSENPDWFWPNDNGSGGNCVCGEGCSWGGDEARRCWFTPYLPDFNFTNPQARDFSVDNALTWIADTGVDGFRLDAVKHIENSWITQLRTRVTEDVESLTGEHFYMVGETFTGDMGEIASYVAPDMLDGQFDFPLRMELARTVLMGQSSMQSLSDFLDNNDAFYGSGIMSTFIGNHDIPRAIHLAQNPPLWDDPWTDGKDRAWSNLPNLPSESGAFERLGNAFTLLLTTKGAPLIYYGDEFGMPGGGDPDNRRTMQWSNYSVAQQRLRDHIAQLLTLRVDHPAMRRGVRTKVEATTDTLTYSMIFGGDTVYVAINRADGARDVGGLPSEALLDELTGATLQGPTLTVEPRSARVLTPM